MRFERGPAPLFAFLTYSVIALVLTWPLVLGLGSDVPGDLGDSLLNMWILAWGAEHLPQLLTGAISWPQFWDANIFHPSPLTLSLSEHLFGQVLQILPVYWLTGNIILCYNLLFISTFALSAFGAYLLVRDLTGDWRAAFIAGLVYGFLPYRIASVPHLQVMSSQWMPFALWGLNRFVTLIPDPGSRIPAYRALALGTGALVLQNWSCGYYLLYFAPFVPLFVLHRMWVARKLLDFRLWGGLIGAAVVTVVLTLPFLLPYWQAQQQFGFERPYQEVLRFSANVWSYATASENLWLFGESLRFYPGPEGETFLGIVPWILAAVGIGALLISTTPSLASTPPVWRRLLVGLLVFVVATQLVAVVSAVLVGGFELNLLGLDIRARSPGRLLWQFAVAVALLLAASPHHRTMAAGALRSPLGFFALATVLAMWLSLGPQPRAGDSLLSGFGVYSLLYEYVPGFNGVRVPARFAMLAGLFLSVMAGYGFAALPRMVRLKPDTKLGADVASGFSRTVATAVIAVLILIEGAAIPIEMNRAWAQNEAMPPARVYPAAEAPPVYRSIAALPAGSAITEFPFGDPAWEIRYVYYAASHWKPVTNGYSGNFPPEYSARVARLRNVAANPDAAWQALVDSGTTHIVLHPAAFANPADATAVQAWLDARGARLVETFDDKDTLYAIR